MSVVPAPARRVPPRRIALGDATPEFVGEISRDSRRARGGSHDLVNVGRAAFDSGVAALALVTLVGAATLEVALLVAPWLGGLLAMIAAALALFAAVTSGLAWISVEPRQKLSWFSAWLGSGALLAGLSMLAMSGSTFGSAPAQWAARLLIGAVPLLLAAALLRIDGELTAFRTLKLVADILVLGLTIVIGATVLRGAADLAPSLSEVAVVESGVFVGAYVCLAFGWVIVARPFLLLREITPPAAIAWGTVMLAAAGGVHGFTLAGVGSSSWVGIPLWMAGLGSVAYGGFLTTRVDREPVGARTDAAALFGSRIHLLPSVLASVLLIGIWSGQAATLSPPSLAVYVASNVLAGLIGVRLIVTVFENSFLLQSIQATIESDESLRDLSVALNASLDLSRVFQHVCKIGAVIMRADQAVLWLVDRRTQELELVELVGRPRTDYVGRRLSLSDAQSLASRVARSGRPEIVMDALANRRSNPFLTTMLHSECLLAVPLMRQDHQAVGVLIFSHGRNPAAFRERDIAKGEVLAVQAVVAMDNARLYGAQRARLQEMSALCQIAQAASRSVSTHELCNELLLILRDVVEYRSATLYLADPGTGVLRAAVHDLRPSGEQGRVSRPIGPSALSAQAFVEARTVSAIYEPSDPEASRAQPPTRLRLAVPLLSGDQAFGVVEVESPDPEAFDRTSIDLLTSLAQNAALAMKNVHLMDEARQVAALKELDRLKDELLATVSHELRTPLGSIKGYSTTLMKHERKLSADERHEFLTIIDEEADRLNELIGNLLDLSSLQAGMLSMRRESIHLLAIGQTTIARAQRRSDRHAVRLEWEADPLVSADAKRIEQVFMNLLVNAIKYSPDGGEVVMRGWVEKGTLIVSVSDQGVGIPSSEIARIFDRFHRVEGELKHMVGGTGLGLAICRRLVDAHHGRIWAESQLGHGSTFFIQLPVLGKEA